MILEKFFTNEFDNETIFSEKDVKFFEFKDFVFAKKLELEKSKITDFVLLCENYFDFAVNFFAAVFAKKNIYLLTDKSRLNYLKNPYFLCRKCTKKSEWKNFENDFLPDKIMINFFTSGSTGKPNLIQKSLQNLEDEARATLENFQFSENFLLCSTTPSSHSYGIAFNFILPFFAGGRIYQTRIEFPEQFPQTEKYILISTPSFMEKLAKYDYKFTNPPEKVFLAGAKTDKKIYDYMNTFTKVIDIYGSTETGNIAYKNSGEIFTVLKGVKVSTDDEKKIVVCSNFFPQKSIVLNDIIEKISDDKFYLKKRTDRVVKILEKRISLTEIENILKENFSSIKDVCCFANGNTLCCAVASFEEEADSSKYKKYLSDFVEIVPKKWRFLDEIPKNISGKIDYEKLQKIFNLNLTFPLIISKNFDKNSYEIKLKFRKNSNFFKGHFDIKPIVPGVVQLYFAKYFIEEFSGENSVKNDVKKIKFSNIISADKEIILQIKKREKFFDIAYLSDDKIYSSAIFEKNSED